MYTNTCVFKANDTFLQNTCAGQSWLASRSGLACRCWFHYKTGRASGLSVAERPTDGAVGIILTKPLQDVHILLSEPKCPQSIVALYLLIDSVSIIPYLNRP